MRADVLVSILDGTTEVLRVTTDVETWSAEECAEALRGLSTVSYEVVGLSARIRAARVNDTPVKHPVKPIKTDDPPPEPKEPPPPPPDQGSDQ